MGNYLLGIVVALVKRKTATTTTTKITTL